MIGALLCYVCIKGVLRERGGRVIISFIVAG